MPSGGITVLKEKMGRIEITEDEEVAALMQVQRIQILRFGQSGHQSSLQGLNSTAEEYKNLKKILVSISQQNKGAQTADKATRGMGPGTADMKQERDGDMSQRRR